MHKSSPPQETESFLRAGMGSCSSLRAHCTEWSSHLFTRFTAEFLCDFPHPPDSSSAPIIQSTVLFCCFPPFAPTGLCSSLIQKPADSVIPTSWLPTGIVQPSPSPNPIHPLRLWDSCISSINSSRWLQPSLNGHSIFSVKNGVSE